VLEGEVKRLGSALRAIGRLVLWGFETDEDLFELKCNAMRRGGFCV
jgi:hypothetical protein